MKTMTMEKHIGLLAAVAAITVLGATGCSTTRQQTKDIPENSGFLGDYSQLKSGVKGHANLFYMKPDVAWAKYTKIHLLPVELWNSGDPDSPMGKISPENQKVLIDLFHTALNTALCTNFTMVDHGGPDVLVIHSAITEAKKSKPVIGAVSSIYLPLKVIAFAKQEIMGTGIGVGSVTIEAEFLDGQSNDRLCAIVDSRSGTEAIRSKFTGTWGDVEKSFDWWANRLDTRLEQLKQGDTSIESP